MIKFVDRPSRHEVYMNIALMMARRSTCTRASVGAALVQDYRVISTGYVGAPAGLQHCTDIGCRIDEKVGGCIRTIHAEANAIVFAAKTGISTKGSVLYTTHEPCIACAKMLINAGVTRVVYKNKYREPGTELLKEAGVDVVDVVELY